MISGDLLKITADLPFSKLVGSDYLGN